MDFAFFILQQICGFDWLLEKQWVGTLESISSLQLDLVTQGYYQIILLRRAPRISHATTPESWIPVDSLNSLISAVLVRSG